MEVAAIIGAFERYPAYQDSGEYWMGEIPKQWEIKKLKHVFREKKKVTNPNLSCGSISFGKVVHKDDERIPEATKASYQEVLAGEYLINPLNLNYDLISLRIGLSNIDVVVSSGYIVLQAAKKLDKLYFNYLLHRYDVAYMKLLGSGVRQTISFNHIANSLLAFPPLQEQSAIAQFLDDKTAKIDRAIAQKEKLIALLKERKQIIIQDLVTGKKVWNPAQNAFTAPTRVKPSDVEWIGEIPEHWEVKRLKFLVKGHFSGGTPSTDKLEYWDGGIPWISSVDVKSDYLVNTARNISDAGLKKSSSNIAPKGSVVFVTRSGILQHTFALSILVKDMAINQDIKCLLFSAEINALYFLRLIQGNNSKVLVETRQQAATVESINMPTFFNMFIPIPSNDEQNSIVKQIENQSQKIDKAINLQGQQIEKLKVLKSSLIDAAVTGKIKVN